MQIYDTESQCLQNEDLNPFDFWSQRRDSLPILSTVAGVVLAAPANFCAIDRILTNCSLSMKKDDRHQSCSGWITGDRDGFGLETFFRYNNNAKELL
uniref:HAT C-terminal dimerisation domain-containing protein n=1 Tax=Romanomermis culicivorax TaxID=13658 RepID=A0A915ISK8_ROMCU